MTPLFSSSLALRLVVLSLLAAIPLACSSEPSEDSDVQNHDAGELGIDAGEVRVDASRDGDVAPAGCTRQGFATLRVDAEQQDSVVITAVDSFGAPYALLSIELRGDAASVGSYPLALGSLVDCETCVLAFADCGATGCEHTYVASSGTLEVTTLESGLGGQVMASLHDVVLTEVELSADFVPTPMEDGEPWCIESLELQTTLTGETLPEVDCSAGPEVWTLGEVSARYQPSTLYGPLLTVTGKTSAAAPWDQIVLELFQDAGAPTEPGVYPLDYQNYADCGTCVRAGKICSSSGCAEGEYLLVGGSLEITATGTSGERFAATLKDAQLFEHSFPSGSRSEPVASGRSFCLAPLGFDALITP